MRSAWCALAWLAVLVPVLAVGPSDLGGARDALEARLTEITPPADSTQARELKSLTQALASLVAYEGSASKADLKRLATLVKCLAKAASPDPDVQGILGLVHDQQAYLAVAARQAASERLAFLLQESSRLKVETAIATGDALLAEAEAAWPASATAGTKGQAKAIATYQKAAAAADKAISKEAATQAQPYAGPPPAPGLVTYTDAGTELAVEAYPGQVQVLLEPPVVAASARELLSGLGGSVLAQLPAVGYYLVGVAPGQEGPFIEQARAQAGVYLAWPHLAGHYAAAGATVIDDCGGSHGQAVSAVLSDRGVSIANCRSDGGSRPVPIWTLWEAEAEIIAHRTAPTLINISSYQGWNSGVRWEDQLEEDRRSALTRYTDDRRALLKAIAELPLPYRENLAITLCAGNDHMPLDSVLAELAADPALADVLRRNVLVVGSQGQGFSNYASILLDDFVWVSNPESAEGTSYAAPYALALISKVMEQRGVTATEALQIVKAAAAANLEHELVESEVLPVDPASTFAGQVAGATTDSIDGSVWNATVALDLTATVSGTGIIGDPYQARLDFAGTLSETLSHCADPEGCDPGGMYLVSGTGEQTSLGRISVTALLGGMDDGLTVRLTNGTITGDPLRLTGTVTVDSFAFDRPVTQEVSLGFVSGASRAGGAKERAAGAKVAE